MWFKAVPGTTSVGAGGETFTPNDEGFFEAPDYLQTALLADRTIVAQAPLNLEAQTHVGPQDETKTAAEQKAPDALTKSSAATKKAEDEKG